MRMKHLLHYMLRFGQKKTFVNMDIGAFLCAMLAYLVNYNTLNAEFVYDDSRAILNNPDILPSTPISSIWRNDFWGTAINSSNSHGSYRPLCVVSFRLNYWLAGLKPASYHATNVLLHCLSTYLVLTLARVFVPQQAQITAALLFAVHPVHCEAVASIVGRADILANIFFVLSLLCYIEHVKHRNRWPLITERCKPSASTTARYHNRITKYAPATAITYFGYKCCEAEYHTKTYRLSSLLKNLFELLKLNHFTGNFDGIPRKVSECSEVREWACLLASLILASAAMLSKETGITVLLMCAIYDFVTTKTHLHCKRYRLFRSILILGCAMVVLLTIRFRIMGNHSRPEFATSDNPTSKSKCLLTRTLTFLYLPVFNFLLLLYPMELSFDWGMDAIPRVSTIFDARNIVSLLFYTLAYNFLKRSFLRSFRKSYAHSLSACPFAGESARCYYAICQYTWKKQSNHHHNHHQHHHHHHSQHHRHQQNNNDEDYYVQQQIRCCYGYCQQQQSQKQFQSHESYACQPQLTDTYLLSASLMILPFVPASNLFFYVGFVVAERILYTPSVGYCFLLAAAIDVFERRTNCKKIRYLFGFLVLVFAIRTVHRNKDWNNEESLYRSGIVINPPKAYVNLGSILSSQGKVEEAEEVLNLALKYRPNMAEAHYNLGIIKQGKGKIDDAINSYQMAIHYRPSMALAYLNLGQLLAKRGRCEKAEEILRKCYRLDGTGLKDARTHHNTRITALMNLGQIQADRGKYWESIATYKEAIQSLPKYYEHTQTLYNLLGESLTQIGEHEEAERWYKLAVEVKPSRMETNLMYGKLLAKNKTRTAEAEKWFLKALEIAPTDPSVHLHFGTFLEDAERYSEAAEQYLKAVKLAPKKYGLIMNAATALREAGHVHEAEHMYRQALDLNPNDASAHANLAAMLHLNGKVKEAISSYEKAIRLNPSDRRVIENLNKLKNSLRKQRILRLTTRYSSSN